MLVGRVVGCVVDKVHGQSGFTKRYPYILSSSVTKRRDTTNKKHEKKYKAEKLKQRLRMMI